MIDIDNIQAIIEENIKDKVKPEHTEYEHFYRYVPSGELYPSTTTRSSIIAMPYLKNWAAKLAVNHIEEEVSKGGLVDWDELKEEAMNQHKEVLEDAGTIGTIGHDAIEDYLNAWIKNGEQPENIIDFIQWEEGFEEDSRAYAIVRSAEKFINDYHVEPIAPELRVVNERYGYGGMLDLLAKAAEVEVEGDKECPSTNGAHNFMIYSRSRDIHECGHCGRRIRYYLTLIDWKTSNSVMKPKYAMQVASYWYALKEMADIKPDKILIVQLDKSRMKYTVVKPTHRPSAFKAFRDIGKVYNWLNDEDKKIEKVSQKKQIELFGSEDGMTEI
jgi:CRISPR/Cas system-associated exonuclease Cas4 (RecB family)